MIVKDNTPLNRRLLFAWLHARTLIDPSLDFRAVGYVNRDLQLIAVAGYNSFVGKTALIHFATDDPAAITRGFTREVFRFPFADLNLSHLLGVVNSHNVKAMTFDLHVGFREVHRIPGGHDDGGDLVFLQMDRAGCPWLKDHNHGEEATQSAELCRFGEAAGSDRCTGGNAAELREPTEHLDPLWEANMEHRSIH